MTMPPESQDLVEDDRSCNKPPNHTDHSNNNTPKEQEFLPDEPLWLLQQREQEKWGEPLVLPEWTTTQCDNDSSSSYRSKHGWQGRDLIHDARAPVRITEYYVKYGPDGQGLPSALFEEENDGDDDNDDNTKTKRPRQGGIGTTLTGICLFTPRAESHKGYCHGGSMCSVLDDVIGWCGFCATGQCLPWSGFTVQINTKLQKPISCQNTYLLVRATVVRLERRKVYMEAEILEGSLDDDGNETVHASGEGLVVLNKGVLPEFATRGSLHSWPSSVAIT